MPAALLLDLDDTLIDDRGAMATAVLRFRKNHSLAIHVDDAIVAERWDTVGRSLWRKLALGEVSFAEQRRMRLRETFSIALTDEEADSLFRLGMSQDLGADFDHPSVAEASSVRRHCLYRLSRGAWRKHP